MNILLIGGTGTISTAVTARLLQDGHQVWLLNRGNSPAPAGAGHLAADIQREEEAAFLLHDRSFDAVVNFVAYTPADIQRDYRLFAGKTGQYVFISSASAYQKPGTPLPLREDAPLRNPYWSYSRDKIACEHLLARLAQQQHFPVTIVRPSHTYADAKVPVGLYGSTSWQVIRRLRAHKPVIIHGDGTSLWTFTHSRDFAFGLCGLLGNSSALGQAVHITSDEALTWTAAYNTIAHILGVALQPLYVSSQFLVQAGRSAGYHWEGPLLGDKANSMVFDNTKIKTLVPEFYAATRFEQGLRATISHIDATPALQSRDEAFDAFCDRLVAKTEQALADFGR